MNRTNSTEIKSDSSYNALKNTSAKVKTEFRNGTKIRISICATWNSEMKK